MLRYVNINGHMLSMQNVMVNIGSFLGIIVVALLLYKQYGKTENTEKTGRKIGRYIVILMLTEVVIAKTIGPFLGRWIRGMSYAFSEITTNKAEYIWENAGTHFIGTVLASAVLLPVVFRIVYEKKERRNILNALAFFFPIQHIFNRLGCLMEGCCYGVPMHGAGSIKIPDEILTYRVFPSQILEIVCMVLLLCGLLFCLKKKGPVFALSMGGFGMSIFLSEFFMDKTGVMQYFGLTVIQFFALLLCGIALVLWVSSKTEK